MNTRAWSHESEHQDGVQSRPLAETQACQKGVPADFDLLQPELHTLFVHHHIEQLDAGLVAFIRMARQHLPLPEHAEQGRARARGVIHEIVGVAAPRIDAGQSCALGRRNLVLRRMQEEGKITPSEEAAAKKTPLGLHIQYPRNDLAPYFFEELRKYLESTYGTEAVHERGLRVYTTLNVGMQRAANLAVRDGLHAYDRRHGWRGGLPNILKDNLETLERYEDADW